MVVVLLTTLATRRTLLSRRTAWQRLSLPSSPCSKAQGMCRGMDRVKAADGPSIHPVAAVCHAGTTATTGGAGAAASADHDRCGDVSGELDSHPGSVRCQLRASGRPDVAVTAPLQQPSIHAINVCTCTTAQSRRYTAARCCIISIGADNSGTPKYTCHATLRAAPRVD